jgi:hypothetical protein
MLLIVILLSIFMLSMIQLIVILLGDILMSFCCLLCQNDERHSADHNTIECHSVIPLIIVLLNVILSFC